MLVRMTCGCLVALALTGCDCGDPAVDIYPAGSGEPARTVWRVGDTASVFAELGYVGDTPDAACPRYGSRPASNYRGEVEPDSFAFQSSAPAVASVSNHGLITALQAGETDIRASHVSTGVRSPPLRITVQP